MAGFYLSSIRQDQRFRQHWSTSGAGIAAPLDVTTWDATYRNATYITLSAGNLVATCAAPPSWAAVLATTKIVGKKYWEFEVTSGSINVMLGVGRRTMSLSKFCGQDADTYGYYASSGVKYNNNASAGYGSSYTTGDIIGCAVDTVAGKVWWSKNGVWIASGDPAAGTGEAYSGLSGDMYPCSSNNTACTITGDFASASLSYAPPTGFSPL